MKVLLNRLINHESISANEAKQILISISKGDYNQAQIASFLTVYMMRSITVAELQGFRDALLELCIAVDLKDYNPIDLCGTGGDGKNTFNISTLSSFVTAGAGVAVAKHGNYGVSSACGSSNVLEAIGITFSNDAQTICDLTYINDSNKRIIKSQINSLQTAGATNIWAGLNKGLNQYHNDKNNINDCSYCSIECLLNTNKCQNNIPLQNI